MPSFRRLEVGALLACLLLTACPGGGDPVSAPPAFLPSTPPSGPDEAPVVADGEVRGQVRVFVSSAGIAAVGEPTERSVELRRAINVPRSSAQAPAPTLRVPAQVTFADDAPRKRLGAPGSSDVRVIPGDLIIGTDRRLDAEALLRNLAPRLQGLRCNHGGFASESLQLLRCVGLDGAPLDTAQTLSWVDRLRSAPGVSFVEPNTVAQAYRVPNDTFYARQWHYRAMGLEAAWDITTGSTGVVVAVLDTGVGDNADLQPNELAGIDLVSDAASALDGDGRDDDPSDACGPLDPRSGGSAWHGTHVAGTIAAASNNGRGVAGTAWGSRVLPVRVLGKEGGTTFDIAAGITWATGGAVPGTRVNTTVARVVNMSLGGDGPPSQTYQSAIDAATLRGAIVVVAAGNDDEDTAEKTPCNQTNVICVAATDLRGYATQYTNFGKEVTLSAPGGATDRDDDGDGTPDGVFSTIGGDRYASMQGTSMATPHVAGLVALLLSVKPNLSFAQVRTALTAASTPVTNCQTSCGAGLVNAMKAITNVQGLATTAPARLTLNVSSLVLTSDAPKRTVLLSNVGGTATSVAFFGSGDQLANISWNAATVPLPLAAGQTVALEIGWTGGFTKDVEVPLAFEAGLLRVEFVARVRAPRPAPQTFIALLRLNEQGKWIRQTGAMAQADGRFVLRAPPGEYFLAGVSDDDGDGTFEDDEGFGMWPNVAEPQSIRLEAARLIEGYNFTVAPE